MRRLWWIILWVTLGWSDVTIDIQSIKHQIQQDPTDLPSLLIAGRYYYKKGRFDQAQEYFKKVLALDANESTAQSFMRRIQLDRLLLHRRFIDPNEGYRFVIDTLYAQKRYDLLVEAAEYFPVDQLDMIARRHLAQALYLKGRLKKALALVEGIKHDDAALLLKGDILVAKKDYHAAEKIFQALYRRTEALTYAQKLLDLYLAMGALEKMQIWMQRLSDHEEFIAPYRARYKKALKAQIEALRVQYKKSPTQEHLVALFWAYYNAGYKKEALALLRQALTKHPDKKVMQLYAKVLIWEGLYQEAQSLLKKHLDDQAAKLLYAKSLTWSGRYEKARELWRSLASDKKDRKRYLEARKMLAFIDRWQGRTQRAYQALRKLAKEMPDDQEIKEALMEMDGSYIQLIAIYEERLAQSPKDAQILKRLIDLYQSAGRIQEAIKKGEYYLACYPNDLLIYRRLGELYLQLKRFSQAFSYLEYWAQLQGDPTAKLILARHYHWSGFNQEALSVVDEVLVSFPKNREAITLKANILRLNPRFMLGQNQGSVAAYEKSRAKKLLRFGDKAYFAGYYHDALRYYDKYLALDPDDFEVKERYAYALEYAKLHRLAAGEFFHLLWMKRPPDPIHRYHLAFNLQRSGQLQRAQRIYRELLQTLPNRSLPPFVSHFLKQWQECWQRRDLECYSALYDRKRFGQAWRQHKAAIFKRSGAIEVEMIDPLLVHQEKNRYTVRFYQRYRAQKQKKEDRGYKTLQLRCVDQQCYILKERWQEGPYRPRSPLDRLRAITEHNLALIEKEQAQQKVQKLDVDQLIESVKKKVKAPSVSPPKVP